MVDRGVCSTHLRRLGALPYFGTIQDAAFSSWISAAAKSCDDTEHLIRAVDSILRARVLPQTPEDITDAANATREYEQSEAIAYGECCGRFVPGWTYLSHDPETPVTKPEAMLEAEIPKYLLPSRCVRGWVHRTIWKAVGPERIDEEGNPIRQPYEFAWRCKCQPGGVI